MEYFASGPKRNYYGKGEVTVYRLSREQATLFGATVKMLVYGDAFWRTYTEGDNTGLIATDSMKNFIQRETMNFSAMDLESYVRFLASKFLDRYPQVEGIQLEAREIPYRPLLNQRLAFEPGGPCRGTARCEFDRNGVVEVASGLTGFRLVRLGGSAFSGFVRDEYTTLPEIQNRPLHMWLDVEWTYTAPALAFTEGRVTQQVRTLIENIFGAFESGSIQQIIHRVGTSMLAEIPEVLDIHLEANNRTWDTVLEQGESGVFTDPRPPYGCLGLRLRRGQ